MVRKYIAVVILITGFFTILSFLCVAYGIFKEKKNYPFGSSSNLVLQSSIN